MLWNEAIESIAPAPEVESKAKPRKRPADDKASAAKRAKNAEGDVSSAASAAAAAAAAAADDDAGPHVVEAGTGSTVYQIYHRAFECASSDSHRRILFLHHSGLITRPLGTMHWPSELSLPR
jgi:hypothetical protein